MSFVFRDARPSSGSKFYLCCDFFDAVRCKNATNHQSESGICVRIDFTLRFLWLGFNRTSNLGKNSLPKKQPIL
jgi:hypothetical protein